MIQKNNQLSSQTRETLFEILSTRFEQNMSRHEGIVWADVKARLDENATKLWSLEQMESTGGEPDVVGYDADTDEFVFYDCANESPQGRRKVCYDQAGLASRKAHKPENSAVEMAEAMGIELLTAEQYRQLQKLGVFDTKTSSWIKTPSAIRELGGALFGDRRYDQVFIYHNGAQSYYGARGFRGVLKV